MCFSYHSIYCGILGLFTFWLNNRPKGLIILYTPRCKFFEIPFLLLMGLHVLDSDPYPSPRKSSAYLNVSGQDNAPPVLKVGLSRHRRTLLIPWPGPRGIHILLLRHGLVKIPWMSEVVRYYHIDFNWSKPSWKFHFLLLRVVRV